MPALMTQLTPRANARRNSAANQTQLQDANPDANPSAHPTPIPTPIQRAAKGPGGGLMTKLPGREIGGYNPSGIAREYHTVIAKNIRDGS